MSGLVLFEDTEVERFLPLVWTRPVFDLRCGITTLREAVETAYGRRVDGVWVRPFLRDVLRQAGVAANEQRADDEPVLLLNGRLLASAGMAEAIAPEGDPLVFRNQQGHVLGARVAKLRFDPEGLPVLDDLPETTVDWPLLEWPWELNQRNGERIAEQALDFPLGRHPELSGVHLVNPEQIHIAATAEVQPGVVLDATAGPLVIDSDAIVMANAVVQGPCFVGPRSQVKLGAKIYHGTTLGPFCKVGGEVEATVFQGYANKQHDGYLGHAFLGEWCNLGAGTSNSDLKNNYSPVRVWSAQQWRDTGSSFVGLMMGDHSKTGINSSLNTGAVVGVRCNLFGPGLPPKFTPSFSWGGEQSLSEYRLEDALQTARRAMGRRGRDLSEAEECMLRYVFDATAGERQADWS